MLLVIATEYYRGKLFLHLMYTTTLLRRSNCIITLIHLRS